MEAERNRFGYGTENSVPIRCMNYSNPEAKYCITLTCPSLRRRCTEEKLHQLKRLSNITAAARILYGHTRSGVVTERRRGGKSETGRRTKSGRRKQHQPDDIGGDETATKRRGDCDAKIAIGIIPPICLQTLNKLMPDNHKLYCHPQSLRLKAAFKRRNMFYKNKKQETTEIGQTRPFNMSLGDDSEDDTSCPDLNNETSALLREQDQGANVSSILEEDA
ncbi:hypothetical protein AAG570_006580 [Ranatra chinensis]|uniref:Uncharacterized protein n=1 Tax=Ranatra chinensis TaxID=642074 RepID=A0ABD0ZFP3_9HEMI